MTTVMQPFQCDLQPEIPKHPITTHTQAHPKQLQATVTLRQKKRQTDRSRNRRTHEVPCIVACSHFTRKNTRFRAPASSPKHGPCNIMQPLQCGSQHQLANLHLSTHTQAHPKQLQATVTLWQKKKTNGPQPHPSHTRGTFHRRLQPLYTEKHKVSCSGFLPKTRPMQHHAAITMRFAASTRKLAPMYAQNNSGTPNDNSHAAIPMRSATGDSKTPSNYAHTSTPKAASSHRYTAAKKKRQTDRSRTRHTHEVPFIVACSHFTRKNTRFRAPASSPKHSPCNIMQPLQCGSQHQLANLHLSTHRTTAEHQMTTVMQPFQCDLQPEIPKHLITTHTQAHPKQLQATVTPRQKKRQTDRSRTRRTHEVPFIVACSHFRRKNTRFRAPVSSPARHLPSSPLPFLTTSHRHHLASSPLPFVTTSLRHHFPSSPLPFVTTSLRHHFPSSPLPFVTTSLHHHFPSSPLPFVTTRHYHHPSSRSIPPLLTLLLCIVL